MIKKIKNLIGYIENKDTPFVFFVLSFFFVLILRDFIEIFSDVAQISFDNFYHFGVSFIAVALALIVVYYYATKERIENIARVILFCFFIILAGPFLDLLISGGRGYNIAYMFPSNVDNILMKFLTFFGSFSVRGVTPGIRIEIALIVVGSLIYFYIKNNRLIKSTIFSFLVYTVIFFLFATPFAVKILLDVFSVNFDDRSGIVIVNYYLFLILFFGAWIFFLYSKKYFISIVRDIRIFRLAHYELMFVAGLILGHSFQNTKIALDQYSIFSYAFIVVSIAFAWIYSVITNNLSDFEIDKISNKDRPLVVNSICKKTYKKLSWIFLFLAGLYSWSVNFQSFFLIMVFIGNYFLYSMPPIRFKRVPFFSKLAISINSLILVMLGFVHSGVSLQNFPKIIILFFLVCLTAIVSFIDIKDYKGDKKEGVLTLPVLLGEKYAKILIGLFFLLGYLAAFPILRRITTVPNYTIWILLFFGLAQFFVVNKKKYNEKLIFLVYFISLIVITLQLL